MISSLFAFLAAALAWLDLALLTSLLWLLSFLPERLRGRWYTTLFRYWCRVFVRALGVELRLHQQNAQPLPKRYVMIANHPSAFEDIGLPALFPVYSLAKEEVRSWWIVGRIAAAAGTLFVQRESRESRRAAAAELGHALERGQNVALYPEGGCKGRRLADHFKFGAFDVSLATGTAIVPVFIHYEAQEVFEWKPGETLLAKLWHFLTSPNRVANYYVFDAFDPAEFADKRTYNQYVYERYLEWQRRFLE
jgi:1-acyl-sn-glycerol-3-phosphate acyltransferase